MVKPLSFYRHQLAFRAVHIEILRADSTVISNASGFILRESKDFFLYTCWHVITGYNPHDIKINGNVPDRVSVRINLQDSDDRPEVGLTVIGGKQTITLPLYDKVDIPRDPVWLQDRQHLPHTDLNNINLKVPFWHDAVKLKLPKSIRLDEVQIIPEEEKWSNLATVGDKILIVGYPYGFSAAGLDQPTPIVLTRHVAANRIQGHRSELLLDGPGTPGMSGSPVFIERDNKIMLLGIYTGNIYPDFQEGSNILGTTLGRCCNLSIAFFHMPFLPVNSELSQAVTNYTPA